MNETMRPRFNPPPMPEALQDLRVFTVEEAHEALAALERRLGVVEVDLVVGEEPEDGVEFEVVTSLREHIGGSVARTWDHMPLQRQALFALKFVATDPGEIVALPLK